MKLIIAFLIIALLAGCGENTRFVDRKIPEKLLVCENVDLPPGVLSNRQISILLLSYDTNLNICVSNMDSIRKLKNSS